MSVGRRTQAWARQSDARPRRPTELEAELAELLEHGQLASAATALIRGYGPELLGYLVAIMRNDDWARDVFAQVCEDIWRGLPAFRRECSVRTWCYVIAWNAARRFDKEAYRRRVRRIDTSELDAVVQQVSSHQIEVDRTRAAQLRAQLTELDQTLLILRVDRELAWDEIARVLSTPEEPLTSAAVRKRFMRIKERLRVLATESAP